MDDTRLGPVRYSTAMYVLIGIASFLWGGIVTLFTIALLN